MTLTIDRFKRIFNGTVSPDLYEVRKEKVQEALEQLKTATQTLKDAKGPAQVLTQTALTLELRLTQADKVAKTDVKKACEQLNPVKKEARTAAAAAEQAVKDNVNYQRRLGKVDAALATAASALSGLTEVNAPDTKLEKVLQQAKQLRDNVVKKCTDHTQLTAQFKALDAVKKAARQVSGTAFNAYKNKLHAPETRLQVTVSGSDEPVEVHPLMLRDFETLNPQQRQDAVQAIGEKIKRGRALMKKMMQSPDELEDVQPTIKDVADLAWAMQTKSEGKVGEPFSRGATTIPDPGYKIRKYLDRCENVRDDGRSEVYNRGSSHLKGHQTKPGGSPRGVDLYEGTLTQPDGLLPYGLPTMTFQSFKVGDDDERLFLKMEDHGCRISNKMDGYDDDVVKNRNVRGLRDFTESFKHGLSFLFHPNYPGEFDSFRESDIPGPMKQAYADLLKGTAAVVKSTGNGQGLLTVLQAGAKKKEIGSMITSLFAAVDLLPTLDAPDEDIGPLFAAINKFQRAAFDAFGSTVDQLGSRLGNEAVLSKEDLV